MSLVLSSSNMDKTRTCHCTWCRYEMKPSERCWLCQPRNLWSNSSFRPRSGVRFSFNLHDKFTCSIVQMRIKITLEITLKRNVFHIAIRYDEFVHGITTRFECFDLFVVVSMCFSNCLLS